MTDQPADVNVVFTPAGVQARVAPGTSLLDAARSVGVDLDSTCGGRGLCGRCQVTPSVGEFAKWGVTSDASSVTPWTTSEAAYKGRRRIEPGSRLGCQADALTDVVVDIPPASQVHRPVVRKRIDLSGLTIDPLVTARYLELAEPELGDERFLAGERPGIGLLGVHDRTQLRLAFGEIRCVPGVPGHVVEFIGVDGQVV